MKGTIKGIIRGRMIEKYKDASLETMKELAEKGYYAIIDGGELVGLEYYREGEHE